ncbi:MAG: hypothetical protein AB7P18_09525 [Candidatus Binatia bacterium]
MNKEELFQLLDKDELTFQATALMAWEMNAVNNIDDVAAFMYKSGPLPPQASAKRSDLEELLKRDNRPPKTYWDSVKVEFHSFLCSEDERYKELWTRLGKLANKGTPVLVTTISAYMGNKLGTEAGIISGFCAVCLYGVLKIGKEALCRHLSAATE